MQLPGQSKASSSISDMKCSRELTISTQNIPASKLKKNRTFLLEDIDGCLNISDKAPNVSAVEHFLQFSLIPFLKCSLTNLLHNPSIIIFPINDLKLRKVRRNASNVLGSNLFCKNQIKIFETIKISQI